MRKKKLLLILLTAIILVITMIIIFMYLNNRSKYAYNIEKVTEINYNVINKNDRYGVIDRGGQVIIEPIYDIIQIPNPSKAIFICMYDYDVEKREYTTKVFNEKGEELYNSYDYIQAIPSEITEDGIPFEKTVLKYKKDGKYGLLGINGDQITEAEYDQINSMMYKEGMLIVKQGEKFGIININGKTVVDIEYESITADNYYNEKTKYKATGFIVGQKKENGYKYGYINYKGNIVVDTMYTEIERVTEIEEDNNVYLIAIKDGQVGLLKNKKIILNHEYEDISYNLYNNVFIIQRNGKQGITTRKGKITIPTEYDSILFGGVYINAKKDDNIYILDLNGNKIENTDIISKIPTKNGEYNIVTNQEEKYKIVDKQGSTVIDKDYTYIEEIDNSHFIVANGNINGIIDLSGKAVVDLKYSSIFKLAGTELIQANISSHNTISLIDKNMNVIATMDNANIRINDSYIHLYSNTENKYFDYTGKSLTNKEVFPNNLLYAKLINDKWGFVDKNGNLKVQNEYEMVTEFNQYGFAGIKKDGKWGVIDTNGNVIQEPVYTLDWNNPEFIGKFYKQMDWYGELYYTDKIEK